MHRRPYKYLTALSLLPLLAGCVQATRHSNTMVFATNTTFGIKTGTNTGQVPEIVVGYDRQEAVIMPLLANTSSESERNRLKPCKVEDTDLAVKGGSKYAVHPCSFVAVNGKAMDSYSVLASFGAEFDAGSGTASGGLAQYFSTGIAAQLLALTGGASVVATSPAATAAALNTSDPQTTLEALYGDDADIEVGRGVADDYGTFIKSLGEKIDAVPSPATNLVAKMTAFEAAAATQNKIAPSCKTADNCKSIIKSAYALDYSFNKDKYENALKAW